MYSSTTLLPPVDKFWNTEAEYVQGRMSASCFWVSYTVDVCMYNHTREYTPPPMTPKSTTIESQCRWNILATDKLLVIVKTALFQREQNVFIRHNQRECISIVKGIAQWSKSFPSWLLVKFLLPALPSFLVSELLFSTFVRPECTCLSKSTHMSIGNK